MWVCQCLPLRPLSLSPVLQVFAATPASNAVLVDSGQVYTTAANLNATATLHNLTDATPYTVWLVAQDMQSSPLRQTTATPVAWTQPRLTPPQLNASIVAGSQASGHRSATLGKTLLAMGCMPTCVGCGPGHSLLKQPQLISDVLLPLAFRPTSCRQRQPGHSACQAPDSNACVCLRQHSCASTREVSHILIPCSVSRASHA